MCRTRAAVSGIPRRLDRRLAAWIRAGGKIDDISQTVHAYPTFTEGQARAADDDLRATYLRPGVLRLTRPALAMRRRIDRAR